MKKSEELYQQIIELDALYQKRKPVRAFKCFLVYVVLFLVLFYVMGNKDFVDVGVQAVVIAAIVFFVNTLVFYPLVEAAKNEDDYLDSLKKEYEGLIRRGL